MPAPVTQDSLGRYRLSGGYGGGQWENAAFSCEGTLLSSTPVRYRSGGGQIDAWVEPNWRVTAFGGGTTHTVGVTEAIDSASSTPYIESYDGAFGGVQVAYEGQRFGAGLGLTRVSGSDGFLAPAPYLRIGNMDKAHFRFDALSPNPAFPTTGWGRIGVGYNKGHLRGTGGFVGFALGPTDYESKLALAGELGFPIGGSLSGQVQALGGVGNRVNQWNAGFGLRLDFGRR
ncbi:MAG TPA: hypothetical protein VGJ83_03890 [Gemmatimonadales bacterium]